VLAWPRPEPNAPTLPHPSTLRGEAQQPLREAGQDLDGVRSYRRGDSMRQVVWKKVAKSGQLVSRETHAAGARELWLDWGAALAPDVEQRLSRLAAWVQSAERSGLAYGLRLPGAELNPGNGEAHRRQALDRLAHF
jgi:uncharacterized protein (DUF58 family)